MRPSLLRHPVPSLHLTLPEYGLCWTTSVLSSCGTVSHKLRHLLFAKSSFNIVSCRFYQVVVGFRRSLELVSGPLYHEDDEK